MIWRAAPLPDLRQRRVLFAIAVDQAGIDPEVCRLLMLLRQSPDAMQGACGALLIDGAGELYTKQLAAGAAGSGGQSGRLLADRASRCWKATGSLQQSGHPRQASWVYLTGRPMTPWRSSWCGGCRNSAAPRVAGAEAPDAPRIEPEAPPTPWLWDGGSASCFQRQAADSEELSLRNGDDS